MSTLRELGRIQVQKVSSGDIRIQIYCDVELVDQMGYPRLLSVTDHDCEKSAADQRWNHKVGIHFAASWIARPIRGLDTNGQPECN